MNQSTNKRFLWLFAGLFLVLFLFASYNEVTGLAKEKVVTPHEMIKAIVLSELIDSAQPSQLPDISEVPLELHPLFMLIQEDEKTKKFIGTMLYIYNPTTDESSLVYMLNNNSVLLYNSSKGPQISQQLMQTFLDEVTSVYHQTL